LYYVCGQVIRGSGHLASWLAGAGLPRLGRISYAYYLCHGVILKAFHALAHALLPGTSHGLVMFWAGLPISYGLTLLAGWGWFHLVAGRLANLVMALDHRTESRHSLDSHAAASHNAAVA